MGFISASLGACARASKTTFLAVECNVSSPWPDHKLLSQDFIWATQPTGVSRQCNMLCESSKRLQYYRGCRSLPSLQNLFDICDLDVNVEYEWLLSGIRYSTVWWMPTVAIYRATMQFKTCRAQFLPTSTQLVQKFGMSPFQSEQPWWKLKAVGQSDSFRNPVFTSKACIYSLDHQMCLHFAVLHWI